MNPDPFEIKRLLVWHLFQELKSESEPIKSLSVWHGFQKCARNELESLDENNNKKHILQCIHN